MARSSVSPHAPSGSPVRTCVGCRQRSAKVELVRVVAEELGGGLRIVADPRGCAPGRGAHLHPTPACLELALRRRAFPRALRLPAGSRLETGPVEAYVAQLAEQQDPYPTDRRWSSSS